MLGHCPQGRLASALLSPQPNSQAPRIPRKLSRARKKDPLGLGSGGLASLLDIFACLVKGAIDIVIIVLIIVKFNSLAQVIRQNLGSKK